MKSKKIRFTSVLVITLHVAFFLISCSSQNVRKLLKNGSVENKDFYETYKYEPYGNGIIVKVLIKNREYRLLFDTGAVTTVSPKMVKELNLESLNQHEVYDIGSTSRALNFVKIDSINFSGINFFDTAAAVVDIAAAKDFNCLGIDGFLGANFMRNAITGDIK